MKTATITSLIYFACVSAIVAESPPLPGQQPPNAGFPGGQAGFYDSFNHIGPDYHHASTWQEGMLRGQGTLMDAAARLDYLASLASLNRALCESLEMENQLRSAETQTRLRQIRDNTRKAEMQARMARIRAENLARHPSAKPAPAVVNGNRVDFPEYLKGQQFSEYRAGIERIVTERSQSGRISAEDIPTLESMNESLVHDLRENVQDIPPKDYVAAKTFVRQLARELRQPYNIAPANSLAGQGR
jgi:hypothetical protein